MKIQGIWKIPLRSIGVPPYQTRCKWARTASRTRYNEKISKKKNLFLWIMENHELWSPGSTFQWCFYGGNYIGSFWGSLIELARPDGAVTFTRLRRASSSLLLCALSTAESLSCPKSIGSIGGTPIFQGQQYSNCSKAGGCRVAPLVRGFGRNLLIVSRVTLTPGCTRVQLIFQEIDTASRVFCAHRADLPKSYLGTCRVSDQNNFHPFFAVYI
jgi:hypothetical protein